LEVYYILSFDLSNTFEQLVSNITQLAPKLLHLGTDVKLLFPAFSGGIPAVNEIFYILIDIYFIFALPHRRVSHVLRDHGSKFF